MADVTVVDVQKTRDHLPHKLLEQLRRDLEFVYVEKVPQVVTVAVHYDHGGLVLLHNSPRLHHEPVIQHFKDLLLRFQRFLCFGTLHVIVPEHLYRVFPARGLVPGQFYHAEGTLTEDPFVFQHVQVRVKLLNRCRKKIVGKEFSISSKKVS